MDVPFHSSGALSRAHYAIVRKVETASSVQSADQHLFLEVKSIHEQLVHPRLQPEKCKECLIILLYCSNSVTPGFLPNDAFDFAFTYAINLAEAGTKIENKRIGYLFCSEMMPLNHELRLMLVNTLRKDLESDDISRICLALDNLIASPNEDAIPAVQSRLHDLLSHDYSHVKRRALLAFRALSVHNPALLYRIQSTIVKRLKDVDHSVVKAALVLLREQDEATLSKGRKKVNDLLIAELSYTNDSDSSMILQILGALQTIGLLDTTIPHLLDLLRGYSTSKGAKLMREAVILDIFKLLGRLKSDTFASAEDSQKISAVQTITYLLMSNKQNDNYLFICCLECIDASNWAGTTPNRPAVLHGEAFERIMKLLNSPDESTAKKTMRIINKVDPAILDAQILLITQTVLKDSSNTKVIAYLLDITLIRYETDGGQYASHIIELIQNLEKTSKQPHVFREVVETILTDIRTSQSFNFLASCAERFIRAIVEADVQLGATGLVIAAALSTEYSGSLPTTPARLLSGLASRLKECPLIVQEPCIIAMIRVTADCDVVPIEVTDAVNDISQHARRLVRVRCSQFIEFVQKKDELMRIIHAAASSSLPDFLLALQDHTGEQPRSTTSTPQVSRASSRTSKPIGNLKYAAYAPPQVGPGLKTRRLSSSQKSPSSPGSDTLSKRQSHYTSGSQFGSPLMSAGQLALTGGLEDIHIHENERLLLQGGRILVDLQSPRTDLISLDSPFHAEPIATLESSEGEEGDGDFEGIWDAFNVACDLRGWCKMSIDLIIRRLQRFERHRLRVIAADVPPFEGELKILMVSDETNPSPLNSNAIALRLRESEDDFCLWRLRCADVIVGTQIQRILDT